MPRKTHPADVSAVLLDALREIADTHPPLSDESERVSRLDGAGRDGPTCWRDVVRDIQRVARAAIAKAEAS